MEDSSNIRDKILCVDDEPSILKSLWRTLQDEPYDLILANSGLEALELLSKHDIKLVVSDMKMPGMSGAELLKKISNEYPNTFRIVLSGYADLQSAIDAVNNGKIHRYLQKPWNNDDLKAVLRDGIEKITIINKNKELQAELSSANDKLSNINVELETIVNQRTSQLKSAMARLKSDHGAVLKVLYNQIIVNPLIDGGFAQNVSELCHYLAKKFELPKSESDAIALAGLLSEIGIIGLPIELYQTPYYKLNPEQKKTFASHPIHAQLILSPAAHLQQVSEIILHQFEKYNGSGTPSKLSGLAIPIGSRILSVSRDYWGYQVGKYDKDLLQPKKALQQIKLLQGTNYDPAIVKELQKFVIHDAYEAVNHSPHSISLKELEVGMVLKSPIFNSSKILLLPEGHIFSEITIRKIRELMSKMDETIKVFAEHPNEEK